MTGRFFMRRTFRQGVLGVAACMVLPLSVHAQVTLPSIDLPVDTGRVLGRVDQTLGNVTQRLDPGRLSDLRLLQVRGLLRDHRDTLEPDPNGAPILRNEVTAFAPSNTALEQAKSRGFVIVREQVLEGLDARIVVLKAPAGVPTRRALRMLRKLDAQGVYDFNHVYTASGVVAADKESLNPVASTPAVSTEAVTGIKVGLIDAGVNGSHAVFQHAKIHQFGCSGKNVPSAHGTAVASLLVGRSGAFHGALPGAELYAADVYCGNPAGGAVDAVAAAFAWMSRERVPTINVSLVGPSNLTLLNVVRAVIARGHVVVAAVGNDGPAAPPLYPAAYPGVTGVTGVDARRRVLTEAARGRQVDFAAPGADMAAADAQQTFITVRGTSFASPIVAGLLAASLREPDVEAAARAVAALGSQAIDLGSRGPDLVYGNGLVGDTIRTVLTSVRE